MAILFKKSRAQKRILRNKFHGAARETGTKQKTENANTPAYTLSTEIPASYNDTYVRAIPRDPVSTFVYWEMPVEKAASSGVPDRGNVHVGNDKVHWIQEKVGAWDHHHHHVHYEHHHHNNHHHDNHHQWHDNHNAHHNYHHHTNNQHSHDNHSHIDNHHHHHTNTASTTPPMIMTFDILTCQPVNHQHTPPLSSPSSSIFYNANAKKSA